MKLIPQKSHFSRRHALALVAGVGLTLASGAALAQGAWPSKPVKIVVPFPPGGTTDILARSCRARTGR